MQPAKLDRALAHLLGAELSDWERLELAEKLARLPAEVLAEVMRQLPVIWPVSYALFYAFVEQAAKAAGCLQPRQYPAWARAILDVYEADGLRQAQLFMADVEKNFVCQIRGEAGIRLQDIEPLLLVYARGVLGREVKIVAAPVAGYDTSTLALPAALNLWPLAHHNFLLYKFIVTFQLALERQGTLRQPHSAGQGAQTGGLLHFLTQFTHRRLAEDILGLVEAIRLFRTLQRDYAGLLADCAALIPQLPKGGPVKGLSPQSMLVAQLREWLLSVPPRGTEAAQENQALPEWLSRQLWAHWQGAETVEHSCRLTERLYRQCCRQAGPYQPIELPLFLGELRLAAADAEIDRRRGELAASFIEALGAVLPPQTAGAPEGETDLDEATGAPAARQLQAGIMMLLQPAGEEEQEQKGGPRPGVVTIDGAELQLSAELLALAREVVRAYGQLPAEFIVSAAGRAGQGLAVGTDIGGGASEGQSLAGPLAYDEWDFRRAGFRRNWCRVVVKELTPLQGTFVQATLAKHRGLLCNLRRQFEMMSNRDRRLKRQRDGDEIDLDAVLAAMADNRAGQAPSERLFIRLQRTERDIAALFLVDMSSSTEGWVSTALKEALILMCESLALLGDRYAIYGFSGMRRTRSEIFRIKEFTEPYSETVKAKIAAISPKEYTRMGPAIRHAARIMAATEARVRLLITLSDGKPEDYDGYKGAYAIEDTRHALIEAKGLGIHPFCITVDKEAHAYMAHMYGEVNYIFIDEIGKLPQRMPEIYRNLTT